MTENIPFKEYYLVHMNVFKKLATRETNEKFSKLKTKFP